MSDRKGTPAPFGRVITIQRRDAASLTALAAATTIAWLGLTRTGHVMDLVPYLGAWTLMMAAMMLPSIAPLVLLHRGNRIFIAAGYLTVWAASGILPWAAMMWSFRPSPVLVLAFAGIYELTPLKQACLRGCRNPATFLMERYRSGPFRLGLEHGLWCAGCCAGLMVVLVLAAAMSLAWAAGIALVVLVQKALPWPVATARATGVLLLAIALVRAL